MSEKLYTPVGKKKERDGSTWKGIVRRNPDDDNRFARRKPQSGYSERTPLGGMLEHIQRMFANKNATDEEVRATEEALAESVHNNLIDSKPKKIPEAAE